MTTAAADTALCLACYGGLGGLLKLGRYSVGPAGACAAIAHDAARDA